MVKSEARSAWARPTGEAMRGPIRGRDGALELDHHPSTPIILGADDAETQHDVRRLQTRALDHGWGVR